MSLLHLPIRHKENSKPYFKWLVSILSFGLAKLKVFYFLYLVQTFSRSIVEVTKHCVKSVHIRSFSGQYFPAFTRNTERYSASLCVQSQYGKIRTIKTPNTSTFHAVKVFWHHLTNNVLEFLWQDFTRSNKVSSLNQGI